MKVRDLLEMKRKDIVALLPPESERPRCIRCGKTLRLETTSMDLHAGASLPEKGKFGLCFVPCGKPKPSVFLNDGYTVPYWTGRFGYEGLGFFCTMTCGWRHGLEAAQEKLQHEEDRVHALALSVAKRWHGGN